MKKFIPFLMSMIAIATSCNRQFDAPPANADPEIDVTMSIIDLKARYTAIGDFKRIEDEQIISGVVIADDRSGNFYKQIIIQDETGGIPVLLDGNNVYTQYPVGRRVFIKLKGMMLGDYGGTIQLGLDSSRSSDGRFLNLDGIPQILFDAYIVKGSFNNKVIPKVIVPDDFTKTINDPLLSTLVQINNAEFRDADIDKTYADASKGVSAVNFTIRTCDKQSIVLRNSSYAKFAGLVVPDGNGVLTGIPGIFNNTLQLLIRDTADVQFTGTRCSGQIPIPALKTIEELKAYATGDSSIPAGVFIKGVIVSDTKNESAGNYRLQDATAGIQLRFTSRANPDAVLGDSLTVTVGGLSLSQYNGGLQVNNVEKVTKSGTGSITPRAATISEIIDSNRAWESTVVMIHDVTVTKEFTSASGTNYIIKDATGELNTFVKSTSGITLPARATSITGYVSIYQATAVGSLPETQLTLRSQEDVTGGWGGTFSATYDFADVKNSTGTTDPTPPPTVDGITFGSFSAVGVSATSSAGRFSFKSWPTGADDGKDNFKGKIDLGKYYEVTITPAAGKNIDLSKIIFTLERSSTGIRQASIRSSIDAYAVDLPASIDPKNENLFVAGSGIFQIKDAAITAQNGCTITLGEAYKNISSAVTFRFYGFNAEGNSGSFSIDNVTFEGVVK